MKTYQTAPKHVREIVDHLLKKFYPRILAEKPRIDLLTVAHDSEGSALKHAGYDAQAVIRVVGLKDRAAGRGDLEIVIDEVNYNRLTDEQRVALLDHELYHVTLKTDKEGVVKRDGADRPKFGMRKHDRQLGWFDEIARRHGDNAAEVIQARALIEQAGQVYFPFMKSVLSAPKAKAA